MSDKKYLILSPESIAALASLPSDETGLHALLVDSVAAKPGSLTVGLQLGDGVVWVRVLEQDPLYEVFESLVDVVGEVDAPIYHVLVDSDGCISGDYLSVSADHIPAPDGDRDVVVAQEVFVEPKKPAVKASEKIKASHTREPTRTGSGCLTHGKYDSTPKGKF